MKVLGSAAILFSLLACSSHLDKPVTEVAEMSRDDFMNALRWKQYKVAAEFMLPENRKDFLATFRKLKDIHITDVRLLDLQETAEGRRFETSIEMDYYLLPSVSVKPSASLRTGFILLVKILHKKGSESSPPFPTFHERSSR